jgi:peroxiredoxin
MAKVWVRIVIVMLVVSVVINVGLPHKLRWLTHLIGRTQNTVLAVGTAVPPFEAADLNGQVQRITFEDVSKPTVLYIFTPPCSWCGRNMINFKELLSRRDAEYRFIGLSLAKEGLSEYVATHGLAIPVYTGLSAEMQKTYKLSGAPQTSVISPEGKVLQDWAGAYVGNQKSQVEAFFHVALPGLGSAPPQLSTAKGAGS